jgi:hypothetical protein
VGALLLIGVVGALASPDEDDATVGLVAARNVSSSDAMPSATDDTEATPDPTPEPTVRATPEPTPDPTPEPTVRATPQPTAKPTPVPTPVVTPTPVTSVADQNARRMASDYLAFMAFSRQGLIDQLVFEGFAADVAAAAVDSLDADWFEQAALMAENYLATMAFSRQGLIDQLVFEGFSVDQAVHGVTAVGL